MVLAFHSIWSCYGFWLPNEPRGSWSTFVRSWDLYRFGRASKVETRRSVANQPYNRSLKRQMRAALQYEPVQFTGEQARVVGRSLQALPYPILALAVMLDHVHAIIAHTDRDIRRVVGHIKSEATKNLRAEGFFLEHTPWADHGWNVYLDSDDDVMRAIKYANDNPIRDGMPAQKWNCVVPFAPGALEQARRKRRR